MLESVNMAHLKFTPGKLAQKEFLKEKIRGVLEKDIEK